MQTGAKVGIGIARIQRFRRIVQASEPLLLVVALLSVAILGGCTGIVSASKPTGSTTGAFQLSPATLNFGNVAVGKQSSQTVTISNTGSSSVTVMGATVSNPQFTVSGISLPMTIASGQSGNFTIGVKPTATGTLNGTLTVQGDSSSGSGTVNLAATVTAANPQISLSSSSINFGSVTVGSSGSSNLVISNVGTADLTVTAVSISGAGFGVSGITTPRVIAAGQSSALSLTFGPTATGAASGSLSISSSDPANPILHVNLSGAGTTAPTPGLTISPASFNFGSVVDGQTKSQNFTVTNTGTAPLTISQLSISAAGYSVSGLSASTVAPGNSVSFSAKFAPTTAGNLSGTVNLVSNAANSPTTVALSGTGVAATLTLSFSSTNISFGSVNTGTPVTQNDTITNTGNSNVQISMIKLTGAGYLLSGAGAPVTLSPSQQLTLSVIFDPATAGSANGSIQVISNASGSPTTIALSGTGVVASSHTVSLNWVASTTSTVTGYNVYRSTTSGGGYVKIGSASGLNYTDSAVQNSTTYYYVTTAVDSIGDESVYSNEASAVIP
jgi:hypothetical protein